MKNNPQKIAIIGMSGYFPEAPDLGAFYRNLCAGRDSVRPVAAGRLADCRLQPSDAYQVAGVLDRVDGFDHKFFGMAKRDADCLDPAHRLGLELACAAIEGAGYRLSAFNGTNTGVFLGARPQSAYYKLIDQLADPAVVTGNLSAMAAGRIAFALNLAGPAYMIDTACSSSLVAVHEACQKLIHGEIDYALAGGVNVLTDFPEKNPDALGIASPDGKARAFDAGANGTGVGEGGGLVLLKRYDEALADGDPVLAVILGSATNQDGGRSNGITAPSPVAQAEVITKAWKKADIHPDTITYIEAHGTGTKLGDPIEIQGLTDAFAAATPRRGFCAVSGVKTNIGHLDNAAGIAGLLKAVLALRHRQLFPSVHFRQPNPFIDFENAAVYVNAGLADWQPAGAAPRRCGVSSFGLSGTNAHVVLEEGNDAAPVEPAGGPVRLKLSAKTATAFAAYAERVAQALGAGEAPWRDVTATLATGRDDYAYRAVVTADNKASLLARLTGLPVPDPVRAGSGAAVLLLSDDAVTAAPFDALLAREPVLGRAYAAVLEETGGMPLTEPARGLLRQLALYRCWEELGIPTKALIANGTGKFAKDVVTGRLGLAEAVARLATPLQSEAPDRGKLAGVVSSLLAANHSLAFVELGCGGTLAAALRETGDLARPVLSLVDPTGPGALQIAALYEAGLPVNWSYLYPAGTYRRVEAPTYPFDRVRCWAFEPAHEPFPITLPEPRAAASEAAAVTPAGEALSLEARIEAIWREVLKAGAIDPDDDFFAIGGHSLNGAQVANRIARAFGIEITLDTIFEYGTIRELAGYVRQLVPAAEAEAEPVAAVPPAAVPVTAEVEATPAHYPASYTQERIWFLSQFRDAHAAYNMVTAAALHGTFHPALFRQALAHLYDRHEALRTVFRSVDGEPRQFVNVPGTTAPGWQYVDLTVDPAGGSPPAQAVEALVAAEYATPFDLQAGPLVRACVVRQQPGRYVLLLSLHHLIADGWSMNVLLDELVGAYGSLAANQPVALPPLPVQYRHFVAWQRDQAGDAAYREARAFWLEQFSGELPTLQLPTDKPRPAVKSYRGDHCRTTLPAGLTRQMAAFAETNGYTLFMLLRAAVSTLLYRYTSQPDVVIGAPFNGRTRREWEDQVGLFVNVVGLRTRLDENQSVRSLLDQVREQTLKVYAHQHYPFDHLIGELGLVRDVSRSPLFDVLLAVQNHRDAARTYALDGARFEPYPLAETTSKYDLSFYAETGAGGVDLSLEYCTDLFERATAARLLTHLEAVLTALVTAPDQPLKAVAYLDAAERKRVVEDFNRTARTYDLDQPVHVRFEAQAARTPQGTALRFGERSYTYAELNARANRVAHYLVAERGVRPDDLVAVLADRSDATLIALLGVMKAGAAYLPVAADLPAERIRYMLEDSRVRVLLTDQLPPAGHPVAEEVPALGGATPVGDILRTGHPTTNPDVALTTASRMYVMYTSGSTGKPKGVEIRHRSVLNFLHSMQEYFGVGPGQTLLSVTTFIFDISVLEFFLPLLNGASVTLAAREDVQNPVRLAALIERTQPDIMQGTPSLWQMLVDSGWAGRPAMHLLCGGEKLGRELGRKLLDRGRLWNLYGPTETTVWSTIRRIASAAGLGTIGKPLANTQVHVVDPHGNLCGVGVFGEICIAGEGLAKGYLNRPELTAARFVPNAAAGDGSLMYRTGDRGRWLPNGEVEFLGRTDNQVKLHGYRIEPGEIEDVLRTYPGIGQAVVTVHEPRPHDKELVAYLVADGELCPDAVRQFVGRHVAPYMVPARFVRITALPMTANGKVDRNALSPDRGTPLAATPPQPAPAAPDLEGRIDALVRQVIRVDEVGATRNLFEHGLNSIRVVALHQLLNEAYPGGLDIHDIFSNPSVRQLTQLLGSRLEPAPAPPVPHTEEIEF